MTSVLDRPVVVEGEPQDVVDAVVVAQTNTLKAKALFTVLSDALLFTSPVSARLPFLEAVRLEFGGGQLTAAATDRFVLGVSRVDYTGERFAMMLAGDDAKTLVRIAKTAKRDEDLREVTVEVADADALLPEVTFRFSTGESMRVRGADFTFPKWRHLVPADTSRMGRIAGMGYDPARLLKFTKVRPDEAGAGAPMVVFPSVTSEGRPGPTAIRIGEHFMGVLMPFRPPAGDDWIYQRPGWLDETASVAVSGPEGGR